MDVMYLFTLIIRNHILKKKSNLFAKFLVSVDETVYFGDHFDPIENLIQDNCGL